MKKELSKFIDLKYKDFHKKLVFTKYEFLGVRSQHLKDYAKKLQKDNKFNEFFNNFLKNDKFYEYLQIIAYGINLEKDFNKALKYCDYYLDYVDNWANCDSLAPQSFKKNDILSWASKELKSNKTYRIRFAILCFMRFINIDDGLKLVFSVTSDEYYVNMAKAWYFQVMFAKDYEKTFAFLKENKLEEKCLKLCMQKCRDSLRISKENKERLRLLK